MTLNRRTFRAAIAGREYFIPTTMAVLRAAEDASGVSLIEAVAENRLAAMLQGVLYAGLVSLGITEINGEPLTYGLIGEACDFAETQENYLGLMQAMTPQVAPSGESKNADAEESEKASRGRKSSATATDSSS